MTRRVTLSVDGQRFDWWTSVEIVRDLAEISGSFTVELHDFARARRTFPGIEPRGATPPAIEPGAACELAIDGETVLIGHVDEVKITWSDSQLTFAVSGRDSTGDLVDCAASVDGPVEWRNLKLDEIARRICAPFGIAVRAEADMGDPFPVFSIEVAERAMEAIERGCRQRAILAVSDGVGGLLLTQGGTRRGPAPLTLPGNVHQAVLNRDWKERHSEYVVKGQTRPPRAGGPALVSSVPPIDAGAPEPARPRQAQERAAIVMTGRARDAEITRHRPAVRLSKTQSGGASVQTQADWMLRVARGKGETLTYTVLDWRAGEERTLWRPNELVTVDDPLAGVLGDMIVAAVTFQHGEKGTLTELKLLGPEAFDLVPEGDDDRRESRRRRDANRPLRSTVPALPEDPNR